MPLCVSRLLSRGPRFALMFGLGLILLAPSLGLAQEAGSVAAMAEPKGSQSFLRWMGEASGPIGIVILLMSFYLITVVAWMLFEYRRSVALPDALIRDLHERLSAKQYTESYQRIVDHPSFLARVLAAGVRKLPSGVAPAQKAMELANDDVTMSMEHRTTYLATIGTLGPMIGLVGTVYGMI